jgi:hypothetical protein
MRRHEGGNNQIACDNRTGAPEGLPREFIALAVDFPERIYGTWWYLNDNGTISEPEGWYIWLESLKLLAVSRCDNVAWRIADDYEMSLVDAANQLRR